MLCEMCSNQTATLKVEVEGSKLSVCEKCSRFGRVISRIAPVEHPSPSSKHAQSAQSKDFLKKSESVQIVVPDFSSRIKKARESLGLKQEELAKRLNERESLIHNLESGRIKPDLTLARKLERFLKISLVEQLEIESAKRPVHRSADGLTLGDLINIK